MFLFIELDRDYIGIGIDNKKYIKGVRIGYIAIRYCSVRMVDLLAAHRMEAMLEYGVDEKTATSIVQKWASR